MVSTFKWIYKICPLFQCATKMTINQLTDTHSSLDILWPSYGSRPSRPSHHPLRFGFLFVGPPLRRMDSRPMSPERLSVLKEAVALFAIILFLISSVMPTPPTCSSLGTIPRCSASRPGIPSFLSWAMRRSLWHRAISRSVSTVCSIRPRGTRIGSGIRVRGEDSGWSHWLSSLRQCSRLGAVPAGTQCNGRPNGPLGSPDCNNNSVDTNCIATNHPLYGNTRTVATVPRVRGVAPLYNLQTP